MDIERITKKLQNALKLGGFNIRRELCSHIIKTFTHEGITLQNNVTFESTIKNLCTSLENQSISEQSIEKEHIERALEACLRSGYNGHETILSVINAFEYPKLFYNRDRKIYSIDKGKSKLLADASVKSNLFLERYYSVLQRTRRAFMTKIADKEKEKLQLQTVDYLLTLSDVTLDRTLILGSLLQVSEGKYYLEDPSGIVQLDLSHAKYTDGFFVENSFILVNGYYEDKILHVSSVLLPPGEEYTNSRPSFGNINYFGGVSNVPLRDSKRLKEHMNDNKDEVILFFSDVWLDNPDIFDKFELLFQGFEESPPIAFVFMGNFLSDSHGSEVMNTLKKQFKRLAELISKFSSIVNTSQFVFVPGMSDPCTPHMVPRLPLPKYVTEDMSKILPKAIFATNPCRIQYCTREIVVFRADIVTKLLQGSLHKPSKANIPQCVARTVIGQGHLSPFSLNAMTVHWDFDYCLRLYPLPDLIVIGDRSEGYKTEYKGCQIINPGSFCDDFQFKQYTPFDESVGECAFDNNE